jgi:hypothetical protein
MASLCRCGSYCSLCRRIWPPHTAFVCVGVSALTLDLCVFVFVATDTVRYRRLHPAFGFGATLLIVSFHLTAMASREMVASFRCTSNVVNIWLTEGCLPHRWIEVFRTDYGPMNKTFRALDAGKQADFTEHLLDLMKSRNRAGDHTLVVPREYLEVVIKRK